MAQKWEKRGKINRMIALTVAIVFHLTALYFLTGDSKIDTQNLVPDFAKEWFDKDADQKKPRA